MSATFADVWDDAVVRHAERVFLFFRTEDGSVRQWTYGQFDQLVARVAGTLKEAGVKPGAPVQLVLRNCPAFVALWLATARLGAWMVPVDPASAARDIANQVERVRPVVAVCARERAQVYRDGAAGHVPVVLVVDESVSDLDEGSVLMNGSPVRAVSPALPSTRLAVMFTSGTTSQPKGVLLTHANYVTVAQVMSEVVALQPEHRWYVTLPLFHANAQYYCFAPTIRVGASVALTASFSASRWVEVAAELGVTHASLFAAPIRMILARTPPETAPLALTHVWFAQSLGADHYVQFARLIGIRPRQLYGMTETIAIVTADASTPLTHDVIGHPVAGRTVALCNPATGQAAAQDEPGVITVRGRRGVDLFEGYLDDPATTARVFCEDGDVSWFSTGDLGSRDEAGAIRFVGRIDDVIKVSGENVSLTEVEAALAQVPGVFEVAVIAQPDPVRDHVPVAYVVAMDPAAPPTTEVLTEWAAAHLAPAARPRDWHFLDSLPRTSVGKVRRFQIGQGA